MRILLTILSIFFIASIHSQSVLLMARTPAIKVSTPVIDTVYSDTAQFNLNGTTASIANWVDLNNSGQGPHTAVKSATSNGYTLSTNTTGAWNGVPATTSETNGETTNDGGGFFHNSAGAQTSYMFNFNNPYTGATTDANFKITGLTEDSLYVVEIVPSRDNNIGATTRTMKAIMHDKDGQVTYSNWFGTSTPIEVVGNTSKHIRMFGKARASGELYIYIGGSTNADATTQYGFANTFRIYKMSIRTN